MLELLEVEYLQCLLLLYFLLLLKLFLEQREEGLLECLYLRLPLETDLSCPEIALGIAGAADPASPAYLAPPVGPRTQQVLHTQSDVAVSETFICSAASAPSPAGTE